MKTIIKTLILAFIVGLTIISCSDDDGNAPLPVNEEEIITTVSVTLTPQGGGANVILISRDLDGDGPNDAVVEVSGGLTENTSYSGEVQFLNETETPAENITIEVVEEAEEHQVFYVASGSLNATFEYLDFDANDNPLGTLFSMDTGAASTGTLTVVLRHEPNKPNDGTPSGAGGETDVNVTFDLVIE